VAAFPLRAPSPRSLNVRPADANAADGEVAVASFGSCAGANGWTKKSDLLSSWKLFTKQIMTSNEDAKIRKHVYKSLKRGSPTPLYYPLIGALPSEQARAGHRGLHSPGTVFARGPIQNREWAKGL